MEKSKDFSAKTLEDAIAKAEAELGLERSDFHTEIIERGKSGFLGIGAVAAVVRVTFEAPDEPAPAEKPQGKKHEKQEKPAAKPAKTPAARPERTPAPEQQPAQAAEPRRAEGDQAEQTEKFLTGLLEHMGVKADIEITPRKGGGLDVNLTGSGIGAVIGRRGETLDAVQHLTNYAVNRGSDKRSHINVDAEGYRAKREESLVRVAEKMAAKAIKYKRSMALEPMNSYERHVIHAALQDYEGVTTSSIGSEPRRRVVVSYVPTETKKQDTEYKEWC